MQTLGLLPSRLGRSIVCPGQKLEEMKPWGPQLEEILGRQDYSEVPFGPYKSLHAGAHGVKVVGSTAWQPPVATLSHTDPNKGQANSWTDAAQVACQHIRLNIRSIFLQFRDA